MEKRILSHFEEKLLRLVHHDFKGLSVEEAAEELGMDSNGIKLALKQIKKKCPQLFPILTPQHRAILLMYDKHMSRTSIAGVLGISEKSLIKKIAFLREHKFLWDRKMDQYETQMDSRVKEKF